MFGFSSLHKYTSIMNHSSKLLAVRFLSNCDGLIVSALHPIALHSIPCDFTWTPRRLLQSVCTVTCRAELEFSLRNTNRQMPSIWMDWQVNAVWAFHAPSIIRPLAHFILSNTTRLPSVKHPIFTLQKITLHHLASHFYKWRIPPGLKPNTIQTRATRKLAFCWGWGEKN